MPTESGRPPQIIDPTNGDLRIHGFTLGPAFTRRDFLDSRLARTALVVVENEPWCTYDIRRRKLRDGESFVVWLQYCGEDLKQIHLSHDRPNYPRDYSELSSGGEEQRRRFHDQWCRRQLEGQGGEVVQHRNSLQYQFPWGGVSSELPPQTGFSSLVIWYGDE